jgi:hypothetical protein
LEGRQTSKAFELINFRCWKGTSRDISGASNSKITIGVYSVVLQKYDIVLINFKIRHCCSCYGFDKFGIRFRKQNSPNFGCWRRRYNDGSDFRQIFPLLQINADELTEEISRSVEEVSPLYCVQLNNM